MILTQLKKEIISSNSNEAINLQKKSFFGERIEEKVQYTLTEAFYLLEAKKIKIFIKNKELEKKELEKKLSRIDKKFHLKYLVYKDLRKQGYIVKTGLKFGADFRVYEKGKNPNNSHAKWLVFVEHETNKNSWQEFSSKNRVAHSTKKKLLIAIVDEESDILYFEINWIKP
jgi:tRNA-intron endonuclease